MKLQVSGGAIRKFLFFSLGELLLIFIGITLSMQFSEWNDSRKAKKEELVILEQLKVSFQHDLLEAHEDVTSRNVAKSACEQILSFGSKGISYNDSLDAIFATAYQVFSTSSRISAYEALKSKGFALVSSDELRFEIIKLHDDLIPHLHNSEQIHHDLFFGKLVSFNSRRFNTTDPYSKMKPINYTALIHDQEYLYYLNVLIFYHDFIIEEESRLMKQLEEVIAHLDKEIARIREEVS